MGAVSRRFDESEEMRELPLGTIARVRLVTSGVAKAVFEPGWRWSESVQPTVGGDSCQAHHIGYAIAGRLHVVTGDGAELEIGPGDVYEIEPGHDAWVVGDETYEALESDAKTVETYGQPS